MAIITISRGSYSKGREVAERVAEILGYRSISREVLIGASEQFNIPEIKLRRALHDAPSMLERFTYGKERYLAYITTAFLEQVYHNNVIYHGLAGQFFLKGVSHVLKVRILAEMGDRVALEMEREKVGREEALSLLKKDDQGRWQWSRYLFGIDQYDPSLYDMILHVHKLKVEDVVNIICETARLEQFKATLDSQRILGNLLLAAQVKARLVHDFPKTQVHAAGTMVTVEARYNRAVEPELAEAIKAVALETPGVEEVYVQSPRTKC